MANVFRVTGNNLSTNIMRNSKAMKSAVIGIEEKISQMNEGVTQSV